MFKNTVKIEGMMCSMCEAHIADTIRKALPDAKKVSASKSKAEAVFITEEKPQPEQLKDAVNSTGYKFVSFRSEAFEKKRFFKR